MSKDLMFQWREWKTSAPVGHKVLGAGITQKNPQKKQGGRQSLQFPADLSYVKAHSLFQDQKDIQCMKLFYSKQADIYKWKEDGSLVLQLQWETLEDACIVHKETIADNSTQE